MAKNLARHQKRDARQKSVDVIDEIIYDLKRNCKSNILQISVYEIFMNIKIVYR